MSKCEHMTKALFSSALTNDWLCRQVFGTLITGSELCSCIEMHWFACKPHSILDTNT